MKKRLDGIPYTQRLKQLGVNPRNVSHYRDRMKTWIDPASGVRFCRKDEPDPRKWEMSQGIMISRQLYKKRFKVSSGKLV